MTVDKNVDIITQNAENNVRGDFNDNGSIRKGIEKSTEVSGNDGRTDTSSGGNAQEAPKWGSVDQRTKRKIRSIVKAHLNNSPTGSILRLSI